MAVSKTQKQKILTELKDKVAKQKAMVLASITGVKVKDLSRLRKEIKKQKGELKVAKKTLISLAFKDKKIGLDVKKLEGEIALGFAYGDELSPFKILFDFTKGNANLKILGGLIGEELLTKEKAVELAQLPTWDELLGRLVGSLNAPIANFVYALQYNLKGLLQVLTQIKT